MLGNVQGTRVPDGTSTTLYSATPNAGEYSAPTDRNHLFTQVTALSPRDVIRVDTRGDHTYSACRTIPETPPAQPWTLYLADEDGEFRLLGFDFDDHDGTAAGQVRADCETLTTRLTASGVPHLVCASGGRGGRHVWVRLTAPSDAERVYELAHGLKHALPTLDIALLCNPKTGMLRAPGSPHRNGSASIPLPTGGRNEIEQVVYASRGTGPEVVDALLAWCGPGPDTGSVTVTDPVRSIDTRLRRLTGIRRDLPGDVQRLAHAPVTARQDASRIAWRILLAAAHAGWSYTDIRDAADVYPGLIYLTHRRISDGARKPRRRPDRHIWRQWDKALAAAARYRPDTPAGRRPVDAEIAAALAAASAHPLLRAGSHAAALRIVLYALLSTMRTARTLEVDISMRRWALACGLTKSSVHRLARELSSAGVIQRTHRGRGPLADTYRLTFPALKDASGTQEFPPAASPSVRGLEDRLAHDCHDVWTATSLGPVAAAVHHTLLEDPLHTTSSLAVAVGLDDAATSAVVRRLRSVRLIVSTHLEAVDSDEIYRAAARELGVAGRLAARRTRYAAESAVWAWWCDEVTWRTSRGVKPRLQQRVWLGRFPTTPGGRCDWAAALRQILTRSGNSPAA